MNHIAITIAIYILIFSHIYNHSSIILKLVLETYDLIYVSGSVLVNRVTNNSINSIKLKR